MLLESATLQKIVTKNVVKVILESSQLQSNFQLILKALKSHDSLLAQFQNKFTTIEQQLGNLSKGQKENVENVNELDKKYDNQIKNVNIGLNTTDKRLKKVQSFIEQAGRLNPQNPNEQKQREFNKELLQKLEQKIGKCEENLSDLNSKTAKLAQMQQGLKKQEEQTTRLSQQLKQLQKTTQEMISKVKNSQKATDSDQIKKMKKDIQNLNQKMKALQAQMKDMNRDLNEINKPLNKLKDVQEQLFKQNKKISDQIWKLNDQIYKIQRDFKEKEGQTKSLLDDILKQLEELRLLLAKVNLDSRDRTLSAKNAYSLKKPEHQWDTQTPTIRQKIENEDKEQTEKDTQDSNFKKQIIDKLKQQKGEITKAIKRLDLVSHKKGEQDKQRLNRLQQKIRTLEFLVDGKVDEQNLKKWMKYIENKIGYLYRIVNLQNTEEDASIARKNWICLSCDKRLENYKGKIGNHLIGAQLKGKTIDSEILGGGMLFKNKSKIELPQFKK